MGGEKILIAEAEQKITDLASFKLSNAGYLIVTVSGNESVLEKAAEVRPDLFLIGGNLQNKTGLEICSTLKMDPAFLATPIILIVDSDFDQSELQNLQFKPEDLLVKPFTPKNLLLKVNEHVTQYRLIKQMNPKTLLPGKVQLMNAVNTLINEGSGFELVFIDLKGFSVYNKIYGFENGDNVIQITADVLRQALSQNGYPLAGLYHLGGDDFAVLTQGSFSENFFQQTIELFQEEIIKQYNEEDAQRGGIAYTNRRGLIEQSPVMTIHLGLVSNRQRQIKNWLEAEAIGTELLRYSKTMPGNRWVKDRRRS